MLKSKGRVRKMTKVVDVDGVKIGGGNPVVVQSMTNTDTRQVEETLSQIEELVDGGCELVRLAVPDMEAARKLERIVQRSPVPLVADIHFDPNLALASLEAGASKLRLNPGNIEDPARIKEIALAAEKRDVPIRIGVNSGSLSRDKIERFGGRTAEAMVESAREEIRLLEEVGFKKIVVSLKSSDPREMIRANRAFVEEYDYPLHLGVTEAGGGRAGIIKSTLGIGTLLFQGIGDTIRVSLTGDPAEEVAVAYEILASLGLRERGVRFVSCPTCGRTQIPLAPLCESLEDRLADLENSPRVSLMGCGVNGIGEAKESEVGLVGVPRGALLYREGRMVELVEDRTVEALAERVEKEVRDYLDDR